MILLKGHGARWRVQDCSTAIGIGRDAAEQASAARREYKEGVVGMVSLLVRCPTDLLKEKQAMLGGGLNRFVLAQIVFLQGGKVSIGLW